MIRLLVPIAASLVAFVATPASAQAACPADNHQELHTLDTANAASATSPDLAKWAAELERRAKLCPGDYEGLGYMALQMINIAQREPDGPKSLAYSDQAMALLRAQAAVFASNTPPLKVTGADGKEITSFTYANVTNAVINTLLPRMAQWANAGTVHASMAGPAKLTCPYPARAGATVEDEAKFWGKALKQASWLKPEWPINRMANLATACPAFAPYFRLAEAQLQDHAVEAIEYRMERARAEAGLYPTVTEKEEIAAINAERKIQATKAARAYDAFFATKFWENEDLEYLREGYRNTHLPIEKQPGPRRKELKQIAGLPAD